MTQTADRVGGLLFIAFGALLYFIIIPSQVEVVDSGWVLPESVPNFVAISLAVLGICLIWKPTPVPIGEWKSHPRALLFFSLICGGVALMGWFGFTVIAPILALAIMWFMGERRPLWLLIGVVALPFTIWLLVVPILDRVLP